MAWSVISVQPVFWIDSNQIAGITSGSKISTFTEHSTRGLTVSQSTAAYRPYYYTNRVKSLPAIVFTGAAVQGLNLSSNITDFHCTTLSVFVVYKPATVVDYNSAYQGFMGRQIKGSSYDGHFGIGTVRNTDCPNPTGLKEVVSMWAATGYGGTAVCGDCVLNDLMPNLITYMVNSTVTDTIRINRQAREVEEFTNGRLYEAYGDFNYCNLIGNIAAGSIAGYDAPLNGDLCEIVVFDSYLSDLDRDAVEKYLYRKWVK